MALAEDQIKKALKAHGGFISNVAAALNVTTHAIYKRIRESEELRRELNDVRESYLDLAESKLVKKVNEEDLGAICFYLKCQGKKRGWVERQERQLSGPDNGPVQVVRLDPEDYKQLRQKMIEADDC